jgi:hypothetical protein
VASRSAARSLPPLHAGPAAGHCFHEERHHEWRNAHLDLAKKRLEREWESFDGPEMRRWRQERKRAFEIINAEVDALLVILPELAGMPDEEQAEDIAMRLYDDDHEDKDEDGTWYRIWDRAKERVSLATLARAAYLLRLRQVAEPLRELIESKVARGRKSGRATSWDQYDCQIIDPSRLAGTLVILSRISLKPAHALASSSASRGSPCPQPSIGFGLARGA